MLLTKMSAPGTFLRRALLLALTTAPLTLATGCSDSDDDKKDGGAEEGPVFGIGSLVTANEVSTDYLLLVPDLDFAGADLKLDEAREFSGQSDLAAHEGTLLASSGDEPTIVK